MLDYSSKSAVWGRVRWTSQEMEIFGQSLTYSIKYALNGSNFRDFLAAQVWGQSCKSLES